MAIFYHRGSRGDIIYALPTIISLGGGDLYIGGKRIFATCLAPLLEKQPCIHKIEYCAEKHKLTIDYDLDKFRSLDNKKRLLTRCHLEAFHLDFDLTQPWLIAEPKHVADIVINITNRYRDKKDIDYSLLKSYQHVTTFVGSDEEWKAFREETNLDIQWTSTKDAWELACVIKGCKLFIGNQSLPFAIAEALKQPRILEVCHATPNTLPQSHNGHVVLSRSILLRYLFNTPPILKIL